MNVWNKDYFFNKVTIRDDSEIRVPTIEMDNVSAVLKAEDLAFGLLGRT